MNLRFQRRWFIEHQYSEIIGHRGNSYKSFKSILQYFDPDKQEWKDLPIVDDEDSKKKVEEDMRKLK